MIASLPVELMRAIRLTVVFALVTGLLYSLAFTGIAQVIFPNQANGSLITKDGQVVGSSLIGQEFKSNKYFHGRVSASATPYAADNSAGSNLGPNNKALIDRVASSARTARTDNGLAPDAQVPVDLVTADFSGFDPDITEASALLQVHRVALARGLDESTLRALVEGHVQGRVLWIFGEPHVNVLQLNLALDAGEPG
ncbi:MAG: potassium-transporting ATPase KdpC subunit [Chloroflexota bacterium]|nr:potassium-transporting ATPase KdpC subunit [Chloroflexota bacterium]